MRELKTKRNDEFSIFMNMVWSCTAVILNYLINFLITPYVTNNIGVEAYGFVSLATTFTNYVDIISVGLNAFAGRFISIAYHRNDKERANMFYSSTIIADIILSILVFLPCLLLMYKLDYFLNIPEELRIDVKILFIVILIKYLLTILRTAFNTATFTANRLDIFEKQHSISYLIQAGILVILCSCFVPHVWYVGLSGAFAAAYLLLVNLRLCRKLTPDLKFKRNKCSIQAIKELVSSGIWNSLNNLGNVMNSGLDLLITNLMLGATILGEISISKNLATICYTLIVKISASFRPKQLRLYAENNIEAQVKMLKQMMKITGMICNLIICIFFACGYDFLNLWIPKQNIDFIFRISMIVLFSDIAVGVVNPLYYVFTLTKRLKVPCCITIGMGLTNILSMYLLLRFTSMGAYAVVLTTLVLNGVHFIDTPIYSAYCLKIKLTTFYPIILRHLIATAIGLSIAKAMSFVVPTANSWLNLIVNGVVYALVLSVVLIMTMFKPVEIACLFHKK